MVRVFVPCGCDLDLCLGQLLQKVVVCAGTQHRGPPPEAHRGRGVRKARQ